MSGRDRPAPYRRRAARPVLAVTAVLCALVSGCGIRATPVPVDAGAAPTRVGCVMPGDQQDPEADRERTEVRTYLVCGSRVSPVERKPDMPGGDSATDRLTAARELLGSLKAVPRDEEAAAGFSTDVPRDLRIAGPRAGDPAETLRLSIPPSELRSFALAQIVCTFAATPVGDTEGNVTLGGPADTTAPPESYTCDTALRTRADAAKNAGKPL